MERRPSGGARSGTAAGEGSGLRGIGAVLELLREEFPEVTVSKIRFLEAEGLIAPRRSAAGHRVFDAEDVRRLGFILRMQRDHYLPLRVIREQFDALATGGADGGPVRRAEPPPTHLPEEGVVPPGGGVFLRGAFLEAAGVSDEELTGWEEAGLLAPRDDGSYDAEALAVARFAARLTRGGACPDRMRQLKEAAERACTAVQELCDPPQPPALPDSGPEAAAEAPDQELVAMSLDLLAALVRSGLHAAGQQECRPSSPQ